MEEKKYNGQFVQVYERTLEDIIFEQVYVKDSVVVLPINEKGELILIKEKRIQESPAIRWKLVTGFLEKEWSILDNANRELAEETNLKANYLKLYQTISNTGTLNSNQHFIIAKKLKECYLPNPDGDVILKIKPFSFKHIVAKILNGKWFQGTQSGFIILKYYLNHISNKS